jgi:hypothetical protein
VTTPPSKGLVVELYLIYFGLAQSFVETGKREPHSRSGDARSFSVGFLKPALVRERRSASVAMWESFFRIAFGYFWDSGS